MNELVLDTGRAVAFLSRIPVPDRFFSKQDTTPARSARAYALAGIIVSVPGAIVLVMLLGAGLDPLFAAALSVVCQLLTTGALHEDGLADCADGLGGGRDRTAALNIMKDSTIGAYGGIALVMVLVLRVSGLAAIATASGPLVAAMAFVSVAVISRAAMVWHWYSLPAAKSDGVAATAGTPDWSVTQMALVSGGLISAALCLPIVGITGVVAFLVLTTIACVVFTRTVRARIDGHTGDTIGATQQICEIAALFALAVWL